jgi:general secretion pathway protein D
MRSTIQTRIFVSLLLTSCLLLVPLSAYAKKGDSHYKKGLQYEAAQQWEKAAQEFTLAVAADPANSEYQLHFRRATFNASQRFMQQGRALADQRDYVGAYNAFRQAYGYDPVNQVAVSEMERMLRLQAVKDGTTVPVAPKEGEENGGGTPGSAQARDAEAALGPTEQLRVISYSGDLKAFIRKLADDLNLNVVFDRTSFAQPRTIDLNLREVTTAQALDYIFLQEGLFFQKLSRRTILVADQTRRAQYQQLVLRTFFLSNTDPDKASSLLTRAIPPSVGRPQTIVVPDKDTNTLTVRDTAENVRLIGDLLQSIDKDRPEVVMDVNIYEVTKSDLMQLGNQIGSGNFSIGGSPGFALLSSAGVLSNASRGVNLASIVGGVPTTAAAALVFPPSVLTAFQSKNNARLVASTQVHAFNNEDSTARIGQRVPVQTAQAYPFGVQTGTTTNPQTGFPSGGFPVINYEPTGLTLKFTPLVYPNFDVQVKMSIESKDVTGANTLTPTFTERTITGTARVQNNRTMMLASVTQDIQSNGRQGLPVLGGLPFLGRLFTSPTRDNRQVDIVIAVTPHVLRAPAVTPRDLEMRPSGTLSNPTTGSIATVLREAASEDRADQIAAARRQQQNATAQVPSVEPAFQAVNSSRQTQKVEMPAEEPRPYVPAPKSLINTQAATEVAAINTGTAGAANAILTSSPKPISTAVGEPGNSRLTRFRLVSADGILRAGDKRRVAIVFNSDVPVGLAVLAVRFDPQVIKVRAVTPGPLLSIGSNAPTINSSVDPSGICLISIAANAGVPIRGAGALFFIDLEAVAAGNDGLVFDREKTSLMAMDAREVVLDLSPMQTTIKQ